MARTYRRRRLGGSGGFTGGTYARTMGLSAVPFKPRKRKSPSGAPLRLGRRVRMRSAGPVTFTKTKKKFKPSVPVKRSENSSSSSTRIGARFRPGVPKSVYKQLLGRRIDYSNGMWTGTSTTGRQKVGFFNIGSAAQYAAMKTALNGGVSTALPLKIFLGYQKWKLSFKNQSNIVGRMVIYDVVGRRMPTASVYDSPEETWKKGMVDFGFTTGENFTDYPGATPLRSPEFRKWFSVRRATVVHLEPGQQHEHTIYRKLNKIVNSTGFDHSSVGWLPGLSLHCVVAFYGSLVSGSDSTEAAPKVSFAPIQVDSCWTYEISSAMLPGTAPAYAAVSDTIVTGLTAPQFMGENQDVAMAATTVPGG